MHNLSVKILIIVMAYFSSISMTYSDDKTKPYDKQMLIIRTIWVLLHIITCLFIIIGNGRILGLW